MIYTEIKLIVEKELYILMFTIISQKLQQKDTFNRDSYMEVRDSIIENNAATLLDISFYSTQNSDIPLKNILLKINMI